MCLRARLGGRAILDFIDRHSAGVLGHKCFKVLTSPKVSNVITVIPRRFYEGSAVKCSTRHEKQIPH